MRSKRPDIITAVASRDWIYWIASAKQAETRARRIKNKYFLPRLIMMIVLVANDMQLYQPTHKLAYNL